MLKKLAKKFWRWLKSKPVPKANASLTDWYVWTLHAPSWQVKEVYEKRFNKVFHDDCSLDIDCVENFNYCLGKDNLIREYFENRLFGNPWPVLSQKFVEENEYEIFVLPDDVKSKVKYVKKYAKGKFPKYLIDTKNQVLGMIIRYDCIISEYYNTEIDDRSALYSSDNFFSMKDADYLTVSMLEINRMLSRIGLSRIEGKYWINGGLMGLCVWNDGTVQKYFDGGVFAKILMKMKK